MKNPHYPPDKQDLMISPLFYLRQLVPVIRSLVSICHSLSVLPSVSSDCDGDGGDDDDVHASFLKAYKAGADSSTSACLLDLSKYNIYLVCNRTFADLMEMFWSRIRKSASMCPKLQCSTKTSNKSPQNLGGTGRELGGTGREMGGTRWEPQIPPHKLLP